MATPWGQQKSRDLQFQAQFVLAASRAPLAASAPAVASRRFERNQLCNVCRHKEQRVTQDNGTGISMLIVVMFVLSICRNVEYVWHSSFLRHLSALHAELLAASCSCWNQERCTLQGGGKYQVMYRILVLQYQPDG